MLVQISGCNFFQPKWKFVNHVSNWSYNWRTDFLERESLANFLISAKTWFSVAHCFMYCTSSNYAVGNVFRGWCFLLISTIVLSNLEVNCAVIFQECAGALSQHTPLSTEPGGKDSCSPSLASRVRSGTPGLQLSVHFLCVTFLFFQPAVHALKASSLISWEGICAVWAYLRN